MTTYACLNGHTILSSEDLNGCICPACIGPVKRDSDRILPIVLSVKQEGTE